MVIIIAKLCRGSKDLELAKKILYELSANMVIVKKSMVQFIGYRPGLIDLAEIAVKRPKLIKGAAIADKVLGKAAAVILAFHGAEAIYGHVISSKGLDVLRRHRILVEYGSLVDHIKGKEGGLCPYEKLISEIDDLDTAYRLLVSRLREGPLNAY